MSENFCEKYSPKTTNEIIGNSTSIINLKKWLKNFKKVPKEDSKKQKTTVKKRGRVKKNLPKSCALITGNHGTAKTAAVNLIAKECGYKPYYLSVPDIKNIISLSKTMKKLKEGKRGRKSKKTNIIENENDNENEKDKENEEENEDDDLDSENDEESEKEEKKGAKKVKKQEKNVIDGDANESKGKKNSKELQKNVLSYLKALEGTKNISQFFSKDSSKNKKKDTDKKIVLIADSLESIALLNEKTVIANIRKHNDQYWFFPIIFISDTHHSKLLSDLKKTCETIYFFSPFDSELEKLSRKIESKEKIKFENDEIRTSIAESAQGDIRRLLTILSDLKDIYKTETIGNKELAKYLNFSVNKDSELDIYGVTLKLFHNYGDYGKCMKYYDIDRGLIPLIFHENYLKIVNHKMKGNKSKKRIDLIKKISSMISEGDLVDNIIYSSQIWDLHVVHGYYSVVAPCYYINENDNSPIFTGKMDFTSDYNKASIRSINKKNIGNAEECFGNKPVSDYIHRTKIIKHYIDTDQIGKCVKSVLCGYSNIQTDHISSLLKIDKIRSTKNNLTSKQETQFTKYLEKYKK